MMTEVRVAVIDSGIHADHPHVQGVADGVSIDAGGHEGPDWIDRLGHGTAVAAAIREFAPSVALLAVRVFHGSLTTTVPSLAAAIAWSVRHGADLINLSLGVRGHEHVEVMEAAVREAETGGSLIVAAGQSDGVRWLPGSLDGVLRVELDWACPRGQYVCARDERTLVFRTSGYPRPIPGVEPERNLKGLSFAVANMTGLAARLVAERPVSGYSDLAARLAERASSGQDNPGERGTPIRRD